MEIQLQPYSDDHRATWEAFVGESNNGTLFHRRHFLAYHPKDRFVDHSLMVYKKGRLLALFPAAERQVEGQRNLVSHPGSSYGGFVYPADLSIRDAFDMVGQLKRYARDAGFQRVQLTLPPAIYQQRVSNYLDFALLQNGFGYLKREVSSMLNIESEPEINLTRFKATHRTAVRRAIKQGVQIRESEDYEAFYHILEQNLKIRHNVKPTHTLEELLDLKRRFPHEIRLFGAYHDNRLVAGVVNFTANASVVLAFYISHDEAFQHLRAVNLLFYEIIKWCHQNGFRFLDFGIFTVNEEPNFGLGRFKERFGASGVFRDTFLLAL